MSSSDSDDDFFNVAQSEADYNFNEKNVLIQSKSQLPTSLNIVKQSTTYTNTLSRSSSEESLVSLRKSTTEKIESAKKDSNNSAKAITTTTKDDDKTTKRGRRRTRSDISFSSNSSPNNSLERSRSNSLDLERKRPRRSVPEPDENDDFFKELENLPSPTPNINTTTTKENSIEVYTSHSNETTPSTATQLASRSSSIPIVHSNPKRVYKIRFLSKLEGTINKSVQVKVLGKYTFEKILPPALAGLIKAFQVPAIMKTFYEPNNVSLYRNESVKLLKFMNCNSLNIPQSFENEISDVEIVLVSKEKEKEYEQELNDRIFTDKDSLTESTTQSVSNKSIELNKNEIEQQFEDELKDNEIEQQFEDELKDNEIEQQFEDELKDNEINDDNTKLNLDGVGNSTVDEPLMKIALLGHDNKKLYVNVRNSTPFNKLVEYYRIQKQVPQFKKIILSFDHDDLDLDECVKDYDMEDEDVIDVIVK